MRAHLDPPLGDLPQALGVEQLEGRGAVLAVPDVRTADLTGDREGHGGNAALAENGAGGIEQIGVSVVEGEQARGPRQAGTTIEGRHHLVEADEAPASSPQVVELL